MKSPFYPCHFQFPMKSPFYPTFHHHFTQINGFDFKIQGVYSKEDIPPSHQQNSHYSQQQKEMYVGDKTFKWYQMRGFDWQKMGVKKRHYDISYVYWNLLKRHLLYPLEINHDKSRMSLFSQSWAVTAVRKQRIYKWDGYKSLISSTWNDKNSNGSQEPWGHQTSQMIGHCMDPSKSPLGSYIYIYVIIYV